MAEPHAPEPEGDVESPEGAKAGEQRWGEHCEEGSDGGVGEPSGRAVPGEKC